MSGSGFVLTRTYPAEVEEVWRLWTTRDGIEAWWGPGGYAVTVQAMDLRPGGELRYTMTAVAPEQVAFARQNGMPVATPATLVYTEVDPPRRLAFRHLVDFVPDVAPYEVGHVVELEGVAGGTRLVLSCDAMHDEVWTSRARQGWEAELGKLDALLAGTAAGA